ncbi:MAG TPA: tetratricopeptide repeat protein, partial [bacterium]|nr:tetratricopeptide repeat protein [bacterium]
MRKFILTAVIISVLVIGACATAPVTEEVKKEVVTVKKEPKEPEDWAKYYTEKGMEALEVKDGKVDFESAIKNFDLAIKAYPKSPTLYYNLGLVYQRMGDDQNAVKNYNKALELDPKYPMPVINRAAIYANRLEYNRAIEVCDSFLDKENDKDVIVLSALAGFYLLRGDYINAIQAVRRILIQDQANVDALKNLGMIYFLKRDIGLASMVTTNSYNLRPDDSGIANNRGVLYADQGDDSLAMLYFQNALKNDPKNVSANFNIGAIAMTYGDAETAYERFSIVLSQDPDNLRARVGLGVALRGLSRFNDAEEQYK